MGSDHPRGEPRYGVEIFAFFCFTRCAPREVGLVLAALGVCKVGAIVLVDGEAEAAFEGADMVAEA